MKGEIIKIEKEVFPFSAWSKENFLSSLFSPVSRNYLLTNDKKEIIGYILLYVIKPESHILNFAIKKKYQGKGLGKYLLLNVLDILKKDGIERVYLEVRESNTRAIKLYESTGFVQIARRKNYYAHSAKGGPEDAIVYLKIL